MAEATPVRFRDAFVDRLDLDAVGVRRTPPAAPGRPSSSPGDGRTLSLYGDMTRLRSSRRLAQETRRNVERLWLLRTRHPDVNTRAAFRPATANAVNQGLRAVTLRCDEGALEGAQIDGVAARGDDHGEASNAGEAAGMAPSVAQPLPSAHRP
jgi:hypothetical protein